MTLVMFCSPQLDFRIHLLFGKHFFYAMPARARYLFEKQGFRTCIKSTFLFSLEFQKQEIHEFNARPVP